MWWIFFPISLFGFVSTAQHRAKVDQVGTCGGFIHHFFCGGDNNQNSPAS
jgi:hypothetical protein